MSTIELGYGRQLAGVEGAIELLARDIAERGVMTERGRPRASFRPFLTAVTTWDHLASRIGLSRRARRVGSLEDILRDHADRADASSANGAVRQ